MANTTITRPPQAIDDNNHGGYILITAALLMTWTILFWMIRVTLRVGYNHLFASDDVAAGIGTFLGSVQAILVMLSVSTAGLGKRIDTLSSDRLRRTELLVYSSDLLFPLALAFAKAATSELIARLTRTPKHVIACRVLSIASMLWSVASMLTIGIGCHPSRPWDMVDRCSNLHISWIAIGIIDIVLEICLFILPTLLVWPLRMRWGSKVIVLFAFGSRLPLIAVTAVRLQKMGEIQHSTDYTWDLVLVAILVQVELHYSLMAMTIPCLRPFLKAFDTGTLATYAAQIEIGMGAPPNAEGIALQSLMKPWRWSAGGTSSLLFKTPRISLISTLETPEEAAQQSRGSPVSSDEHPGCRPGTSPDTIRRQQQEEEPVADDSSGRHIIPKPRSGYGQRHSLG